MKLKKKSFDKYPVCSGEFEEKEMENDKFLYSEH